MCVHACICMCMCVVSRHVCVGGIAGQEREICALAFRSTPFLLGLTCGWGCPPGVERGSRPLLWSAGHARFLPASSGDWGDATAQAACRHAWGKLHSLGLGQTQPQVGSRELKTVQNCFAHRSLFSK